MEHEELVLPGVTAFRPELPVTDDLRNGVASSPDRAAAREPTNQGKKQNRPEATDGEASRSHFNTWLHAD